MTVASFVRVIVFVPFTPGGDTFVAAFVSRCGRLSLTPPQTPLRRAAATALLRDLIGGYARATTEVREGTLAI